MSNITEKRNQALRKLVAAYEKELGSTITTGPTFELDRLPDIIQDLIKFTVAKSPSFSNVAALGVINYTLSHTFGQCRPYIDDPTFSTDRIGLNSYNVIISGSGSGKSSTTNALLKVFKPAFELIEQERIKHQKELARAVAYAEAKEQDKDFTEDQVTDAMIEPFLKPLPRITTTVESTRGGLTKLLAKLATEQYSSLGITADELGMSLKANNTINEVLQLLTSNYDMGNVEAPEYKGEEYKEVSVDGMYCNFLAHSSPKIIFGDRTIAERLSVFYATSGARRTFFIFPDQDETNENNEIPAEIGPARELTRSRKLLVANMAPVISDKIKSSVERLLTNNANLALTFSSGAAQLYEDYMDYCIKRSELMEDSSITQIEMAGRAFKVGKLVGIWSLASGSSIISKDILASAIYFAEYISKYLQKFVRLTTANPWELLAEEFISGRSTHITLDQAITSGYIKKVTKDFAELMEPLNSLLRTEGVCTYDPDIKTFIYTKFEKVEQPAANDDQCTFGMSYRMVKGVPKDKRVQYLDSFDKYRDDLCLSNIVNLFTKDTIFNVFQYKEGPSASNPNEIIPHRRRQENIISSTNLIILDIDKSTVPMDIVHEFMEKYQHVIATTSDPTNRNKFRIALPINVHLDGRDKRQYSYVIGRIAADLLLEIDPASKITSQPFYGYAGAEVLVNETGELFDITHYLTEFAASGEEQPQMKKIQKKRSPKARKAHVDKLLDNAAKEFEYAILAPHGEGNIRLVWLAKRCIEEEFTADEYEMLLRYVISLWEYPLPEGKIQRNHLDQFKPQMRQS